MAPDAVCGRSAAIVLSWIDLLHAGATLPQDSGHCALDPTCGRSGSLAQPRVSLSVRTNRRNRPQPEVASIGGIASCRLQREGSDRTRPDG